MAKNLGSSGVTGPIGSIGPNFGAAGVTGAIGPLSRSNSFNGATGPQGITGAFFGTHGVIGATGTTGPFGVRNPKSLKLNKNVINGVVIFLQIVSCISHLVITMF
jgi:hypothetical protein